MTIAISFCYQKIVKINLDAFISSNKNCKLANMKFTQILLFCLFSAVGIAQNSNKNIVLQDSLSIIADDYIGIDAYSNHYFVKDNNFFKINKQDNWQNKNLSLGKISKIDISNPLKIILFYQNFNTVVALDNQLNEVEKINFSAALPELNVAAIGMSSNNNFWVFNDLNQQLGLYNFVKNSYLKIGLPFVNSLKTYHSDFNYFYWIDNNNALYDCDVFGKITLLAKIPDYDTVFIANEKSVLFNKNNELFYFDVVLNKTIFLKNVDKTMKSFYLKDQKLVIFTTNGITQYKINLP